MTEKNENENKCKIHTMPSFITDEDINALFSGLVQIVKRKVEIDNQSKYVDLNISFSKLNQQLKEKQAEIVRLKNEIIYLTQKLKEQNIDF